MAKKVFEIEFKCRNCGEEWSEQFKRGDVVQRPYYSTTIKVNGVRTITCPTCSGKDYITEIIRSPIGV